MRIAVLAFLGVFCSTHTFNLEDPIQGVVVWNSTATPPTAEVNESNDAARAKFALITGVIGEITCVVLASEAAKALYDVQTEAGADATELYLTANVLDYEQLKEDSTPTLIVVEIVEDGEVDKKQRVVFQIKNIDDEKPTFSGPACTMMEATEIVAGNSSCIFSINDPDGFLSAMNFEVAGTNGESDLFEFEYLLEPLAGEQHADVYLVLKAGQTLDYETTSLYSFHINAKDSGGNPTTPVDSIPITVQVADIGDQPPRWTKFDSVITIQEKTTQTVEIRAVDGDVGVNNTIKYAVDDPNNLVTIDETTGLMTITAINRDEGTDQISVTVTASEDPDTNALITGTITILVEDLDDNVALLTVDGPADIPINEGSFDLPFVIHASDIDTDDNALYAVSLKSLGTVNFTSAISVIPSRGYGNTTLSLNILDPALLDFENADWKVITLQLMTKGIKNDSMTATLNVTITLTDINDESPVFEQPEYTATISENVTIGTSVASVVATDKDAEDIAKGVTHELIGTLAKNLFTIAEFGGDITTKTDNVFDFEREPEVTVQIRATDAVGNEATAQLTITVEDVNDEKPRILVGAPLQVEENQADGFVIPSTITATDDDSMPNLEFSIDWTKSYGTKNSVRLPDTIFDTMHFVNVATTRDPATNQTVTAELTITVTQPDNTPDFDVLDTLYLQLVITDANNGVDGMGSDTTMVVISVVDKNDNAPVFPDGTDTEIRTVKENSPDGTEISSLVATDNDVGDTLQYSIQGADANTPNWVTIGADSGKISVSLPAGEALDCDDPARDSLLYNVTVSDGSNSASVIITVNITDENDNPPTMADQEASIPELQNGDTTESVVLTLSPEDIDRDEPFHTVQCTFAATTDISVTTRFAVKDNTIVVALTGGANLDREESDQYIFELNCIDDPTHQGPQSNAITPPPKITINLTDINDNAPTIKNTELFGLLDESSIRGTFMILEGEDLDADANANIEFVEITAIKRFINIDDPTPQADPPQDLFIVKDGDNHQQGLLEVNADNLLGLYGYIVVTISLEDGGTPPLTQDVNVTVQVKKLSFVFSFPASDTPTQTLATEQTPNSALILSDGSTPLSHIKARDNQRDTFGVKFILLDDGGFDVFALVDDGNSEAELQLKTATFTPMLYTLTIMAYDDTPGSEFSQNTTLMIDFATK